MIDVFVLMATAVTAIFTGWAVWQRWRYTPRPTWTTPCAERMGYVIEQGRALVTFSVMNVGDGDALNVEWKVDGAELKIGSRTARLRNGEKTLISAWLPTEAKPKKDSRGNDEPWLDIDTFDPTGVTLTVTWSQHPSARRRQRQFRRLPTSIGREG